MQTVRGTYLLGRTGKLSALPDQDRWVSLGDAIVAIDLRPFMGATEVGFGSPPIGNDFRCKAYPRMPICSPCLIPARATSLFGTTAGIFAVSNAGLARRLESDGVPRGSIGAFAREAGTRRIIAGGDEGLFAVLPDASGVVAIANGAADMIGLVTRITEVPFAGTDIVRAENGTYAIADGTLQKVHDTATAGGILGVLVGWAVTLYLGGLPLLGPMFHTTHGEGDVHLGISTFAVVTSTTLLETVGLVAGLLPAIKAARLDPIESLRYE